MTAEQQNTLELVTKLREMGAVKVTCGDLSVEWSSSPKREEEPVLRKSTISHLPKIEMSSEQHRVMEQFREVLT